MQPSADGQEVPLPVGPDPDDLDGSGIWTKMVRELLSYAKIQDPYEFLLQTTQLGFCLKQQQQQQKKETK